ncbi:hypothetical protein ABIB89_003291 [Bradyrhizobium sp. JR3.12]
MRRYRYIVFAVAALVLCLVPQKVLLFLLPYALKRVGGTFFKHAMKAYKTAADATKLLLAFGG